MLPVILMAIHTAINLVPGTAADIFGGMYHYVPMHTVVKSILNIGTLIVFLMAHEWMKRDDTSFKQGEFYVLTLSTLFGMYLMISAGHFLMFFIGLETASIPMAALIAFDKYRHNSAEAGAKYILTALFSSALLLFGLSMIYGSAGTLYFDDLPAHIDGNPLQIMAFVFFFTGMAFKLSLVPFHLWTADVYEGAPSTVTAYLSVISKGSAAFVLMAILIKVFAPMIHDWQEVLYWVTIASITIANIFAIRQQNLKRLMAFSSISQAGYIMLGVIGGTTRGNDRHGILHTCICRCQSRSICRHHYRSITQSEVYPRRLCRTLQDEPENGFSDDYFAVLTGRYSSVCRILLEVLYFHGSFRSGLPLAGIHCTWLIP